jgi:hypothetical protein
MLDARRRPPPRARAAGRRSCRQAPRTSRLCDRGPQRAHPSRRDRPDRVRRHGARVRGGEDQAGKLTPRRRGARTARRAATRSESAPAPPRRGLAHRPQHSDPCPRPAFRCDRRPGRRAGHAAAPGPHRRRMVRGGIERECAGRIAGRQRAAQAGRSLDHSGRRGLPRSAQAARRPPTGTTSGAEGLAPGAGSRRGARASSSRRAGQSSSPGAARRRGA